MNGYEVYYTKHGLSTKVMTCYSPVRDCFSCGHKAAKNCRRSNRRKLLHDIAFVLPSCVVIVRAGFIWDGASIPGILMGVTRGGAYDDKWFLAALLHDAIYKAQPNTMLFLWLRDNNSKYLPLSRKWTDEQFSNLMKYYDRCDWYTRWKVSTGVAMGGEWSWLENHRDTYVYKRYVDVISRNEFFDEDGNVQLSQFQQKHRIIEEEI